MTEFLKGGTRDLLHREQIRGGQDRRADPDQQAQPRTGGKGAPEYQKKLSGSIDLANRVQKFVDCRTKDVARRELYIVEGDSALGSVKQGRDSEFQAIMPVRGKILNCLKADYDKIFKNDIITDLLKVLGCGVEVRGKAAIKGPVGVRPRQPAVAPRHHLYRCRCGRLPDPHADSDHALPPVPTLIEQGYVYIAESPLYEITYRDKSYFAFDETEKRRLSLKSSRARNPHPALQGSGREPAGHDVGDHHEP